MSVRVVHTQENHLRAELNHPCVWTGAPSKREEGPCVPTHHSPPKMDTGTLALSGRQILRPHFDINLISDSAFVGIS